MAKHIKILIAFVVFLIVLIFTVAIASVVTENNVPLTNIGVFMVSLIPLGLFGVSLGILWNAINN